MSYEERRVRVKNYGILPAGSELLAKIPGTRGRSRRLHTLAATAFGAMAAAVHADLGLELREERQAALAGPAARAVDEGEEGDVALPGYTHMQHAMPSSVALWCGGFDDDGGGDGGGTAGKDGGAAPAGGCGVEDEDIHLARR